MIAIIILLTFIALLLLQDRYFKNKKNYKNKNIKIYQDLKIPIFITCFVVLIYDIMTQKTRYVSRFIHETTLFLKVL